MIIRYKDASIELSFEEYLLLVQLQLLDDVIKIPTKIDATANQQNIIDIFLKKK